MFEVSRQFLEEKVGQLSELLDVSDRFAKGEGRPLNGQFQFLKLSIDTRMRMLERMMPEQQEHSGTVNYVISRDDNSSGPVQASSGPEADTRGNPSV